MGRHASPPLSLCLSSCWSLAIRPFVSPHVALWFALIVHHAGGPGGGVFEAAHPHREHHQGRVGYTGVRASPTSTCMHARIARNGDDATTAAYGTTEPHRWLSFLLDNARVDRDETAAPAKQQHTKQTPSRSSSSRCFRCSHTHIHTDVAHPGGGDGPGLLPPGHHPGHLHPGAPGGLAGTGPGPGAEADAVMCV